MHLLMRHGQTEANALDEFRGTGDWTLTRKGRQQAKAAIPAIKKFNIQRIVCSDLPRAVETAKIVGTTLGLKVHPTRNLRPLDVGEFTGKPKKKNWREFTHYLDHPLEKIPGGESVEHFRIRNQSELHRLLSGDIPTLVVLHTSNITDQHGGRVEDDHVVPPGGLLAVIGPHHFMRVL